jgi:DNA topoisomerase-1
MPKFEKRSSSNRVLVIVESPNKIKTLKEILPSNYIIKASVGHISEINDSGLHNFGIDPNDSFKTDYKISNDKKDVVKELKNQVDLCFKVIIATDGDREGEAIAWSLKKFLNIPESKYERVTFHEITEKAVLKAIDNPGKIDDDLVLASQSRQKLDKIVGYRLSPIARRQINARSVGRVQSAGLKLIVEREEEINNFVPDTYFDLFLNFVKNSKEFKAKYVGTAKKETKKLGSLDEVKSIVADCKKTNVYTVNNIETKEKLSNPKPPFITSTFQQEVSNKLGIGVKQAMSYAQKLFEGIDVNGKHIALITYIRTDSPEFAPEFLPQLESYVKSNYGDKYYSPIRKGKKAENVQDGHEAIRPVDLTMTPEKLSKFVEDANLLKVYNIIYKRTIATAMASAVTSETTYVIKNDVHLFNLVSKELIFDGYKAVYGSFEDKEEETTKETFKVGEILKDTSLEAFEKKTTPPSRYKESTFIKELESRGIGRPSTFASTVDTILSESRGYCVVEDKFIVPTEKGISLSHFLDKSFPDIINVNYTSELEENLDLIANGKLNDIDFLTTFYKKLEEAVNKVQPIEVNSQSTDKVCPECGKNLVYRTGRYGPFLGCSGYPSCKHISKVNK